MRIFLTGATGYLGSVLASELLRDGHRVTGLARSSRAEAMLNSWGAQAWLGSLDDPDTLHEAASGADAVIHTAFKHDFSDYRGAADSDRAAITAMGSALAGTGRPFLVTSGTAVLPQGRLGVETDAGVPTAPRLASEDASLPWADKGVKVTVVRLPPSVHSDADAHGFVPALIAMARDSGVAGYAGDGAQRWPAVHRSDAVQLYRLVLEANDPGTVVHAVAEEGVALRAVAEAIGRRLGLPVRSVPAERFGWLSLFVGMDNPTSSAQTRSRLGWEPTGPGLLDDLAGDAYFR